MLSVVDRNVVMRRIPVQYKSQNTIHGISSFMFLHWATATRDYTTQGAQVEHADPGAWIGVLAPRKSTKCTNTQQHYVRIS